MAANVKVMDYSPQVMRQFEGNKRVALEALGLKAVELIQDGMDTLYGRRSGTPVDCAAMYTMPWRTAVKIPRIS